MQEWKERTWTSAMSSNVVMVCALLFMLATTASTAILVPCLVSWTSFLPPEFSQWWLLLPHRIFTSSFWYLVTANRNLRWASIHSMHICAREIQQKYLKEIQKIFQFTINKSFTLFGGLSDIVSAPSTAKLSQN